MHNLHLGTIGWSYNFWKGNFYPNKTPSNQFLTYYATKFTSVEVDSTFYRIPTEQTVLNWKQQTPPDFLFSLKFPQLITHIKALQDSQSETDSFLSRVNLLAEKLGVLLLQFPPSFGVDNFSNLENYLKSLPKTNRYVVEIRNKSWLTKDFFMLLKSNDVALAWTDNSVMRQTSEVTSDFLYIRWEGDRDKVNGTLGKVETDKTDELKMWTEKLKPYLEKNTEVFGYFAKYFSGYPPSDINLLQKYLT